MIQDNVSNDLMKMIFKQLGAIKISENPTKTHIVEFDMEGKIKVSYLYNAKAEAQVYLQRIKPYPTRGVRFESVGHTVDYVKKDIERFRRAAQSEDLDLFTELAKKVHKIDHTLEEIFLSYKMDKKDIEYIGNQLGKVIERLEELPLISKDK